MFEKIGKRIRRKEDARLLTGQGEFSDDFNEPGQAYAAMVRSPYPHAELKGFDLEAARAMSGVLGIFTGADCLADGLGPIPHNPIPKTDNDLKLHGPNDTDIFIGPHLLLPTDKARHVGEAVAMVVAKTKAQALDAAEAVEVDFEPLDFVSESIDGVSGHAPSLWDEVPSNVFVDTMFGDDPAAVDAEFAKADHVVTMDIHVGRVTGVPLEPRAALGIYDAANKKYTLYAGSGGAVRQKNELIQVLGLKTDTLRVISKDVGGNFGTRNRVYVEFGLVIWAAKKLGCPVKYTSDRSEAFLSDYQGRDLVTNVELAVAKDGTFLAMRADNISNAGARCVSLSPLGKGTALITGNYHIPVACVRARAVYTNTMPTQAYRSSGRPEVTFAIERLVDTAAHELGFDPVELRRKNLIPSSAMPYENPIGATYDSGEYSRSMDMVMKLSDWEGYEARKAETEKRGKLLGRGIANYVESSTGAPIEQTEITVRSDDRIDVVIGTQPSGQGHETSFAQVAAEWLGVGVDQVQIILGDTDIVKIGGGSHSGRSMRMAGTVIVQGCEDLIKKGKRLAAKVLDAKDSDIDFKDGNYFVSDTNISINILDLAKKDDQGELAVIRKNEMHTQVFPNGCHVCEIEVDPDTGFVEIKKYTTVDDVGRAINPLIVDGQTHGGLVQGAGQALWEQCFNDPESGQPLCGSLMDYAYPRADHFPSFDTELNEVPSPTNPLGVKAGGEGGTTPAPAVIINAIVNALRPYGVRDIKMPATPLAVWQAIHEQKN